MCLMVVLTIWLSIEFAFPALMSIDSGRDMLTVHVSRILYPRVRLVVMTPPVI